jgi:hypothetical protein
MFILFIVYFTYQHSNLGSRNAIVTPISTVKAIDSSHTSLYSASSVSILEPPTTKRRIADPLTDPYVPPEQIVSPLIPPIATQPFSAQYTQVGILTRKESKSETGPSDILPLMGRRQRNSRDKWQYYTMSGGANGNIQTKLPIRVKGKSGTNEYGCDEIYTNDAVFVEGYKDVFVVTIYDNNLFSYIA